MAKKKTTSRELTLMERDFLLGGSTKKAPPSTQSIFSHSKWIFMLTAFVALIIDQLTKISISDATIDWGILAIRYVENTGASFGIFAGWNMVFIWISVIAIGAMIYYLDQIPKERLTTFAYGLLFGGILGNFIDRVTNGFVIDFIDFSFWPAFNIADICIVVGVAILVVKLSKQQNT